MLKKIVALSRREDGVTASEYALIAVVVALAMIAGAQLVGSDLSALFGSAGASI